MGSSGGFVFRHHELNEVVSHIFGDKSHTFGDNCHSPRRALPDGAWTLNPEAKPSILNPEP
jgi:hypothetical protein